MALRSRLNLPRATCPVMCSRRHQRAHVTTPAAFDLARGLTASARQMACLGGHAASTQKTDSLRHEKQDSRAEGGGQAQRRTLSTRSNAAARAWVHGPAAQVSNPER